MKPLLPEDPRWLGSHRTIAVIGEGRTGRVLLGRTPTGRLVAIELIHRARAEDPEFRARFERDVVAARQLTGTHIAPVVDSHAGSENLWLATEHIPGPDLRATVAECGPLPLAALRMLAIGLASALTEIHAATLVHRDLEPGKVLLTPEGPRIVGAGVARAQDAATAETGAAEYAAPEQLDDGPVTSAADVFAVGALLAFAATGSSLFAGDSAAKTADNIRHSTPDIKGVPHAIRELVESCLAKDPAKRPTARGLLKAAERVPAESAWPEQVRTFIDSHRTDAQWWARVGEQETLSRDQAAHTAMRRRRVLGWAAAGVVGALAVAGVVAVVGLDGSDEPSAKPQASSPDPSLALTAADLRLLDPCAVLDLSAGKLGTSTGAAASTSAGGCGITIVDSAQRRLDYRLDVGADVDEVVRSMPPTGKTAGWTPILRTPPAANACDSAVITQSGGTVALRLHAQDADPAADPAQVCASAENAMVAVVGQLIEHAPLRTVSDESILRVDPCSVLDTTLVSSLVGDMLHRTETPHECGFTGDGASVRIGLIDETKPDPLAQATVPAGRFTAYAAAAAPENCDLRYLVRTTTGDHAEQVRAVVSDPRGLDACGKAGKLLADVIPRLPTP